MYSYIATAFYIYLLTVSLLVPRPNARKKAMAAFPTHIYIIIAWFAFSIVSTLQYQVDSHTRATQLDDL